MVGMELDRKSSAINATITLSVLSLSENTGAFVCNLDQF